MALPDDMDLTPNRIELARRSKPANSYIDLTSGNPTHNGFVFPAEVLRAASDGYWAQRRYEPDPRGYAPAREAIATYYAQRATNPGANAIGLRTENIFLTASTSEAYGLLFALLTEPGDNVLASNITYPVFELLAQLHHVELRPYALNEQRGWLIDWDDARAQVDARTKAMLIVSPHNPTGRIVTALPDEHGDIPLPIIVDEVFAEFTIRATHAPVLGATASQPVFTLNGISKMFALPDLKLGWVTMNDAAANRHGGAFELINDTFLGANSLSQFMLPALFEKGWDFVQGMARTVRSNVLMAHALLCECDALEVNLPDGGYYLFPRVQGWRDDETLVLHLLDHGVFVHPGYFYNYAGARARIVISCLTEENRLREGIRRLIAAL